MEITKTYNTEDSPVVTDLSTGSAVSSLTRGERTGSRIFYCIWSYVLGDCKTVLDIARETEVWVVLVCSPLLLMVAQPTPTLRNSFIPVAP